MADYNNKIFKPRKDSGFVIKFSLTPDKAAERQKDRDVYKSYSGSYVEEVCPLWVRENKFKF